jgi:hypothetical protein
MPGDGVAVSSTAPIPSRWGSQACRVGRHRHSELAAELVLYSWQAGDVYVQIEGLALKLPPAWMLSTVWLPLLAQLGSPLGSPAPASRMATPVAANSNPGT